MHMKVSKQFLCSCDRCTDPTENSTYLSAIRCQDKTCNGFLLPIDPINFQSNAKCNLCAKICEGQRFLQMQAMFASITRHFLHTSFTQAELDHFIESRLYRNLPDCNQFVVQAKLKAIWKCDLINVDDQMKIKRFCEDILKILDKLGAGECSLKGFLAHKLYTVRKKLSTSKQFLPNSDGAHSQTVDLEIDRFLNNDEELWKTAKTILCNVSAAPDDIMTESTKDSLESAFQPLKIE